MNMLIGVLCEVVGSVTRSETDEAATKLVQESILVELQKFDDGDGMISREELDTVLQDPHSQDILRSLDIDILFLTELQAALFRGAGKTDKRIPIKGILELMLLCRGDLPSTVRHIASGQAFMHSLIAKLEKHVTKEVRKLKASLDLQARWYVEQSHRSSAII